MTLKVQKSLNLLNKYEVCNHNIVFYATAVLPVLPRNMLMGAAILFFVHLELRTMIRDKLRFDGNSNVEGTSISTNFSEHQNMNIEHLSIIPTIDNKT